MQCILHERVDPGPELATSRNPTSVNWLVGPELATVITRLRGDNAGTIPLVARYDYHELVTGPPLPHLFQRRIGWKRDVISTNTLYQLLNDTLARAALTDQTGEPLHFTPHDLRRIFATEAVAGGLPVHIAARLLGHTSTSTTEAYLAIFQEDLIRSCRGPRVASREVVYGFDLIRGFAPASGWCPHS